MSFLKNGPFVRALSGTIFLVTAFLEYLRAPDGLTIFAGIMGAIVGIVGMVQLLKYELVPLIRYIFRDSRRHDS